MWQMFLITQQNPWVSNSAGRPVSQWLISITECCLQVPQSFERVWISWVRNCNFSMDRSIFIACFNKCSLRICVYWVKRELHLKDALGWNIADHVEELKHSLKKIPPRVHAQTFCQLLLIVFVSKQAIFPTQAFDSGWSFCWSHYQCGHGLSAK